MLLLFRFQSRYVDRVCKYILNQREHPKVSFSEEFYQKTLQSYEKYHAKGNKVEEFNDRFSTKVQRRPMDLSAVALVKLEQTRKNKTKFCPKNSVAE
jgi:hypothetical protein